MTLTRDGPPTEARTIESFPPRPLYVEELEALSSDSSLSLFQLAMCSPARACCVSVQTDDGIYVCGFEPDEREWRELVVMAFDEGEGSESDDESEDVLEDLIGHVEESVTDAYEDTDLEVVFLTDVFAEILERTVLADDR